MANPRLPRMATPSASPNSALVADNEAAEPAWSGGAEPTTTSGTTVDMGPAPSPVTTEPITSTACPPGPTNISKPKPAAHTNSPTTITTDRGFRRTSVGDSIEPTMTVNAAGSVHSP